MRNKCLWTVKRFLQESGKREGHSFKLWLSPGFIHTSMNSYWLSSEHKPYLNKIAVEYANRLGGNFPETLPIFQFHEKYGLSQITYPFPTNGGGVTLDVHHTDDWRQTGVVVDTHNVDYREEQNFLFYLWTQYTYYVLEEV